MIEKLRLIQLTKSLKKRETTYQYILGDINALNNPRIDKYQTDLEGQLIENGAKFQKTTPDEPLNSWINKYNLIDTFRAIHPYRKNDLNTQKHTHTQKTQQKIE